MPTEPAEETQLALRPEVAQQLRVVTSAIAISLGVQELTTDFKKRSEELIAAGNAHTKPPEDDDQQAEYLKAQRAIAALRIEAEKQSEAFKAPLNAARTKIIEITKEGVEKLEKAEKHLQGLINARQNRLIAEREAREAEAARAAKKIADEAAAAQRAIEDAERKQREAELAKANAEMLKGQARKKAEQEAAALAAAAEKAKEEAEERALDLELAPKPVAEPVSELPMAKTVKDFELFGSSEIAKQHSLISLVAEYPSLFTIKITEDHPRTYSLTLRVRDLTDRLNGHPKPFDKVPAGIRVTTRTTNLR